MTFLQTDKTFWKQRERFQTPLVYHRPEPPTSSTILKDGLTFQVSDILPGDATLNDIGLPSDTFQGTQRVPTIRVFGVTPKGHTVYVVVYGMWPYIYLEVPCDFQASDVQILHEYLETYLASQLSPYQCTAHASPKLFKTIFGTTLREYLQNDKNKKSSTQARVYPPNNADVEKKLRHTFEMDKIEKRKETMNKHAINIQNETRHEHKRMRQHNKDDLDSLKQMQKDGDMTLEECERARDGIERKSQQINRDENVQIMKEMRKRYGREELLRQDRILEREYNRLLWAWRRATKRYAGRGGKQSYTTKTGRTYSTTATKLSGPLVRSVELDNHPKGTRSLEHSVPCTNHFVRITLSSPRYVITLRNHLESEDFSWQAVLKKDDRFKTHHFKTFESDFAFVNRVWVDKALKDKLNVDGAAWFRVAGHNIKLMSPKQNPTRQQLAFYVVPDQLEPLTQTSYGTKIAPFRIFSYDIECCSQIKNEFPRAERDPAIQIACVIQDHGVARRRRALFHLDTCDPITTADHLFGFEDEADMLAAFAQFSRDCNPEVVTGYNIVDFDYPYLADRARVLAKQTPWYIDDTLPVLDRRIHGIHAFLEQTKVIGEAMRIEDNEYEGGSGLSKKLRQQQKQAKAAQIGLGIMRYVTNAPKKKKKKDDDEDEDKKGRSNKKITMAGMVVMDMLFMIKTFPFPRKHKSFTLNAMSAHYLGSQKLDMDYELIPIYQAGSARDRRRLGEYCLWDAELPLNLSDNLHIFMLLVLFARTVGLPMDTFLKRGTTIRLLISIYRLGAEMGLRVPYHDVSNVDVLGKYKGATVIDPIRGFYTKPVATLDFAALYPSIMLAHNLCWSTFITPQQIKTLGFKEGVDYKVTPVGHAFLTEKHAKGLCAILLSRLLGKRRIAKKDMAAAKERHDKLAAAIHNGLQMAIKVLCNSVYGFTGTATGKLPCFEISTSITAYGRQMIEQTKQIVVEHFRPTDGSVCPTCEMVHRYQAKIIYGGTLF